VNAAQSILVGGIKVYQRIISPIFAAVFQPMGLGCRFHPTCSVYASEAVRQHGAAHGTALAVRRLCRCHPFGGSGFDPVPPCSPRRKEGDFSTTMQRRQRTAAVQNLSEFGGGLLRASASWTAANYSAANQSPSFRGGVEGEGNS
jgi:uncharacterized protein